MCLHLYSTDIFLNQNYSPTIKTAPGWYTKRYDLDGIACQCLYCCIKWTAFLYSTFLVFSTTQSTLDHKQHSPIHTGLLSYTCCTFSITQQRCSFSASVSWSRTLWHKDHRYRKISLVIFVGWFFLNLTMLFMTTQFRNENIIITK